MVQFIEDADDAAWRSKRHPGCPERDQHGGTELDRRLVWKNINPRDLVGAPRLEPGFRSLEGPLTGTEVGFVSIVAVPVGLLTSEGCSDV